MSGSVRISKAHVKQRIGIWNDNAAHIKEHAQHVGAFVINFGFIEWLSYFWITCLQKDSALIRAAVDMQLGQRISVVKTLIDREFEEPKKKDAVKLWERVIQLSQLRNDVCHNPYVFGWTSGIEGGDPDFRITHRTRDALRKKKRGTMPDQKEIVVGVEETGKIANRLFELILDHLKSLIKKRKNPTTESICAEDQQRQH